MIDWQVDTHSGWKNNTSTMLKRIKWPKLKDSEREEKKEEQYIARFLIIYYHRPLRILSIPKEEIGGSVLTFSLFSV